jgi:hypothetical protein
MTTTHVIVVEASLCVFLVYVTSAVMTMLKLT